MDLNALNAHGARGQRVVMPTPSPKTDGSLPKVASGTTRLPEYLLALSALICASLGVLGLYVDVISESGVVQQARPGSGLTSHVTGLMTSMVLFGLGLLLGRQRRLSQALRQTDGLLGSFDTLHSVMGEVAEQVRTVRGDQSTLSASVRAMRTEVAAQTLNNKSAENREAVMRLAGSLDTVHAKLDERIIKAADGIQVSLEEFNSLLEGNTEVILEQLRRRPLESSWQVSASSPDTDSHIPASISHLMAPLDSEENRRAPQQGSGRDPGPGPG